MTEDEIKNILYDHKKWLEGNGGNKANLRGANLRGADLRWANLSEADLSGADLRGADLRGAELPNTDCVLMCNTWPAYIQHDHIRIGCQYHTTEVWEKFTDEEISRMNPKALEWWRRWKKGIMGLAASCERYINEKADD